MDSEKRYNNVIDIIDKRLIPNEAAKKARGEVFTPLTLVREMLFGLRKSALAAGRSEIWGVDATGKCKPDDEADRVGGIPMEVWRNPNTKWLDPANGIGNFPVVAFYMLDYQLGEHGPAEMRGDANKGRRKKHIIENMLYMIEINKGNVNTSRKIFEQMVPGATANICCADSRKITDIKLMEAFGVNRFDVVMGNPPFNPGRIWYDFIKTYTEKTNAHLIFIVPSTFTSNTTGTEVVSYLKAHGLYSVKYLKPEDFLNKIDLGTLYFHLEIGYTGDILVNHNVNIKRTSPIINLTNNKDKSIFEKINKYIDDKGSLQLFKGTNETLKHENPVETPNIKFSRNGSHTHRMLSRLGGGEHEYLWVRSYKIDNNTHHKVVFPRGTGSYSSINNIKNVDKDLVYSTCVEPDEILSTGIMYTLLDAAKDCGHVKFYTMRSKLVRYIFLKINQLAELTPVIFSYIPRIPVSKMISNEDIYQEIGLSKSDIAWIEETLTSKSGRTRTARAAHLNLSRKKRTTATSEGGARRSKHRRTHKNHRYII
jgi:hypothetical protein